MEGERWRKCKKCDAMVTPMFSKKLCFDHLTEELANQLPKEVGFKPAHVKMVLDAVMEHYYPLKHKPRLEEHLKKEWSRDDKSEIEQGGENEESY